MYRGGCEYIEEGVSVGGCECRVCIEEGVSVVCVYTYHR